MKALERSTALHRRVRAFAQRALGKTLHPRGVGDDFESLDRTAASQVARRAGAGATLAGTDASDREARATSERDRSRRSVTSPGRSGFRASSPDRSADTQLLRVRH